MTIEEFDGLCKGLAALQARYGGGDGMEDEYALLRSREVAEILDLSPDTVNEMARKHLLPGRKQGRQWRFRRHDVERLAQGGADEHRMEEC